MTALVLWAARAITPEGTRARVRLRAEQGRITEIIAGVDPRGDEQAFPDGTLAPGLVDLQVNGGDGAGYDSPDAGERARATRFHLRCGTTSLLATLVSAPLEQLEESLARLAAGVDPGGPIVGVHLEGPFLAEEQSGAHDRRALRDPTPEAVDRLLAAAGGTLRLVTLAPERPGALEAIRRFAGGAVVVAAGHSRACHEQVRAAIECGLSFVTHLGNASSWPGRVLDPELGYRRSEPGLVGSFLFEPRLSGSVILDGRHLHPGLVRALVELRGPDRVVLVSDASPAAGLAPGRYSIGGLETRIDPRGFATSGEGLAGSTIPLQQALRVAVQQAGLPLPTAVRMASSAPARILGLDGRKGTLEVGRDADLLLLAPDLSVEAVFHAGRRVR